MYGPFDRIQKSQRMKSSYISRSFGYVIIPLHISIFDVCFTFDCPHIRASPVPRDPEELSRIFNGAPITDEKRNNVIRSKGPIKITIKIKAIPRAEL